MKEVPYKNHEVNGTTKTYDDNGNLILEASVLNDILHGDIKLYTKDGKLLALIKVENQFINGKCFNNKVLTDKDLKEIKNNDINIEKALNYLQEICLNP